MLGIIFVCSVYDNLAMPQFSPTLVALTGITGTYLGFKFVEQQNRVTCIGVLNDEPTRLPCGAHTIHFQRRGSKWAIITKTPQP
jgi:xanthosine utilization system XapX-like protein